ncbi:hypothetical protein B0H13DRAFT_2035605 [Mycena leptocephala]|nr:hypothetical protein B0H13DRAFT_2035605 [Mycena leptocephala]
MPALPTSSPSVPSFSLSPFGVAAVILFVLLVLGGVAKMEERRVKVTDSEVRRASSPIVHSSGYRPRRRCRHCAQRLSTRRNRLPSPSACQTHRMQYVVIGKAPFVATQKSPRERLQQIPTVEVPARFGASRPRPRPGPSPLRTVYAAPAPESESAHAVAKAASQHVEEPAVAHALAGFFASTYQDAEDSDSSHFFDCFYDEEHLFIDLDLGRAVPAPVPVSVTAPPSGVTIIVVESPSLVLGDRRLDGPSSRTRQRSNSFMDSLATRKRAPSMTHQHGGSEGKKGDSRLLQAPKLLDSQDKENENGRQWVPSRPHPARTSP